MARVHHVRQHPTYVARDEDEVIVDESSNVMAARIINLIGTTIIGLLALRFLLSLFGANRGNMFADFIYTVSYPFVAPFFGLFNYTPQFGTVRFEFETLVAILAYALLMTLLIRAVTIDRRNTY